MNTARNIAELFLFIDSNNEGSDGITNLKIQKLTYYAQGFYMALNEGKPLFNERIEAWQHGPVVPDLYQAYKVHSSNTIPAPSTIDYTNYQEDEIELVKEVYEVFGSYSAWKLREMTHEESPWIEHEALSSEIPHYELFDYFSTRIQ